MFDHDEESEMQDPNKAMKIKLLDELIEKIMSMEDGPAEGMPEIESPEMDSGTEMSQEEDAGMKEKLASLKGM